MKEKLKKLYDKIMDFAAKFIAYAGADGILHAYVSTIIMVLLSLIFGAAFGVILTVVICLLKEIVDQKLGSEFSKKDLLMDGVGILVGLIIYIL